MQTERTVSEENIFSSSDSPKFQLNVHPDLEYLGNVEATQSVQKYTATIKHESYLFGQVEGNAYKQGVLIRISTLPSKLRWFGRLFPDDLSGTLDTGVMESQGAKYRYTVVAPVEIFSEEEAEFITGKGYNIPQCYMLKTLGRESRNVRIYIYYFESLSSCKAWDPNSLTQDQQKFLDEFIERSTNKMTFQ
jgi:hypothetical protein